MLSHRVVRTNCNYYLNIVCKLIVTDKKLIIFVTRFSLSQ